MIRSFRLALLLALLLPLATVAGEQAAQETQPNLDSQIQDLKREVLKINRELFLLEEELLFPSSTQVTVFLSVDAGNLFTLDSVKLEIDGKEVAAHLYTTREFNALRRGGVQRLYTGNLKSGDHEVVALFVGKGPQGRDYRRAADLTFTKGMGPKFIELKIVDDETTRQPLFLIEQW